MLGVGKLKKAKRPAPRATSQHDQISMHTLNIIKISLADLKSDEPLFFACLNPPLFAYFDPL
jgi:hypothetical protein